MATTLVIRLDVRHIVSDAANDVRNGFMRLPGLSNKTFYVENKTQGRVPNGTDHRKRFVAGGNHVGLSERQWLKAQRHASIRNRRHHRRERLDQIRCGFVDRRAVDGRPLLRRPKDKNRPANSCTKPQIGRAHV